MNKKFFLNILKNKKFYWFLIIILIAVSYFVYSFFLKQENLSYVLGKVSRGNIEVKVSGSGEVIPLEEINIKTRVGGEIVALNSKEGNRVSFGQVIAKIDSRNLEKTIQDQEILIKNLRLAIESTKLNLEKINFQSQNTLRGDDYKKALNQGVSLVNDFYNFYPNFIDDLKTLYFEKDLDNQDNNLKYYESYNSVFVGKSIQLEDKYNNVKTKYLQLSSTFKNFQGNDEIKEKIIKDFYNLVLATYDLIDEGKEMVRYVKENLAFNRATHEKQSIIESHFQKLTNYLTTVSQYRQNFLDIVSKMNVYHDAVKNYGFDKSNLEIAIKQKELDLEQANKKLRDLKEDLRDYYIKAPFSGVLSVLNIKKGDLVSPNQSIGTLMANQKLAKIALNEIDVAQIKVGQLVVLSLDAFPELKIKGKIIEISSVGKEAQGVVSYDVKILFDDNNPAIKTGMSVSAEIVVDQKENILLVPNSALRKDRNGNYVEVVKNDALQQVDSFKRPIALSKNSIEKRYIVSGISDNQFTEILDGLKEGEIIIIRSLTQQITQGQPQNNPFLPRMPFGQQRR
jgi:RND family efflux transporter MFP subunit